MLCRSRPWERLNSCGSTKVNTTGTAGQSSLERRTYCNAPMPTANDHTERAIFVFRGKEILETKLVFRTIKPVESGAQSNRILFEGSRFIEPRSAETMSR